MPTEPFRPQESSENGPDVCDIRSSQFLRLLPRENECTPCDADLRIVGVREYGLIEFHSHLHWGQREPMVWHHHDGVSYDECGSIDHARPNCERDLGFDPNDPDGY